MNKISKTNYQNGFQPKEKFLTDYYQEKFGNCTGKTDNLRNKSSKYGEKKSYKSF